MSEPATTIYRCGAARDALGIDLRPATVAVSQGRIVAIGPSGRLDLDPPGPVRTVDRPDLLLLPPLVNAHAHLDLTALGPRPYGGSFVGWIRQVMQTAPAGSAAAASVRRGVELSLAGGVGVVGDISRSLDSVQALAEASGGLAAAVGFAECFGIGAGRAAGRAAMANLMEQLILITAAASRPGQPGRVWPGLEPHAPYSAAGKLFDEAAELARRFHLRLTTHLAETQEELTFVRDAAGPLADLLRQLGRWDGSIRPMHAHPVDVLGPALRRGRWLLAHCNYVGDSQIAALARCGASVAYCPVASEYFGHRGHRWRDMLEAGVNVCLGTDSILCQPAGEPQPMGMLPPMRLLHRRDAADPGTLLAMASVHGLRGLGLSESLSALRPGSPAPLGGVRFDPADPAPALTQVLQNGYSFTRLDEPAEKL